MDSNNESLLDKSTNSGTKLVILDKSRNIEYFGPCKISICSIDKCLVMKIEGNELTSTFNRVFIQKKNFLCILDETTKKDFIIICKRTESCEKVFNKICKVKAKTVHLQEEEVVDKDEMFKTEFFIPVIKAIENDPIRFEVLKYLFHDFVNSFDDTQKATYLDLLTKAVDLPSQTSEIDEYLEPTDQKRVSLTNSIMDESSYFYESKNTGSNDNAKIVYFPYYELLKRKCKNQFVQRLIIFSAEDMTLCHEYGWIKSKAYFACLGCRKHCRSIYAKLIKDGENQYIHLETKNHACKPIPYKSEDLTVKIIHKRNFKFEKVENLKHEVLKISDLNGLVYSYRYHKHHRIYFCHGCERKHKSVSAKLCQDKNGQKFVELSNASHVCQPL